MSRSASHSAIVAWTCALGLQSQAVGQAVLYSFTNFVGNPQVSGSTDGSGTAGLFSQPWSAAVGADRTLYVPDTYNHTIRKVTPSGVVTTLAGTPGVTGSADGSGSGASFSEPIGVVVNSAGNLFIIDNSTVRMITPQGMVTTIAGVAGQVGGADGVGAAARFYFPRNLALDSSGNLYIADSFNQTIRKMTPDGTVTTLSGLAGEGGQADGTGSAARFEYPSGVAVDSAGNVYVTDSNNYTIRKITPAGAVTTLAGTVDSWGFRDGPLGVALFNFPENLVVDPAGNLYVADWQNSSIRKVTPDGYVTTVAGKIGTGSADGTGPAAQFNYPHGLAIDSLGRLYVVDTFNDRIAEGFPVPVFTGYSASGTALTWSLDGLLGGATVVVEASTNLTEWFPVQTNIAGPFPSQLPVSQPLRPGPAVEFLRAYSH